MPRLRYLVRFFRVVPPVPRLMVATFAAVTVVAIGLVIIDPTQTANVLTPVFLLQLFAASSGFSSSARRGYYDLLMTRAEGRLWIAAVHWTMSVTPGIASWVVVASAEILTRRDTSGAALASGTVVTMVLLSTMPWAITAALPRFAGAIGWLLVLAIARSLPGGHEGDWLWGGMEAQPSWQAAASVLIYPVVLAGRPLVPDSIIIVLPALTVAAVAMAAASLWIRRADWPLEAAQ